MRPVKELKPEELNRLFTHGIHEEGIFYNRLNFFLIFESLLFAAAISGFGGKENGTPAAIVVLVCVVGILASIVWWYAQINKLVLLSTLEERIKQAFDEFRETIELANQRRIIWLGSANKILAHGIPPIFVVAWGYMVYYQLCWR